MLWRRGGRGKRCYGENVCSMSEKMMGHHYGGSVWESEKGLEKNAAFMDA